VVGAVQVKDDDEVMIVTNGGMLIRMKVNEISVIGRNTQGVRLISLENADEKVVGISRLPEIAAGDIEGGEGGAPPAASGAAPDEAPDAGDASPPDAPEEPEQGE
jgi:DNA gyrase subunit A